LVLVLGSAPASGDVAGALASHFSSATIGTVSDFRRLRATRRGRPVATPGAGVLPNRDSA
jgi:hypothetical protein